METQIDHETTPKETVKKLAKELKPESLQFFGINLKQRNSFRLFQY
jgi:hypothetical protein